MSYKINKNKLNNPPVNIDMFTPSELLDYISSCFRKDRCKHTEGTTIGEGYYRCKDCGEKALMTFDIPPKQANTCKVKNDHYEIKDGKAQACDKDHPEPHEHKGTLGNSIDGVAIHCLECDEDIDVDGNVVTPEPTRLEVMREWFKDNDKDVYRVSKADLNLLLSLIDKKNEALKEIQIRNSVNSKTHKLARKARKD